MCVPSATCAQHVCSCALHSLCSSSTWGVGWSVHNSHTATPAAAAPPRAPPPAAVHKHAQGQGVRTLPQPPPLCLAHAAGTPAVQFGCGGSTSGTCSRKVWSSTYGTSAVQGRIIGERCPARMQYDTVPVRVTLSRTSPVMSHFRRATTSQLLHSS